VYSGGTTVDKVEVSTGIVQPVCPKPGPAIGGAWNRDGTIVFGGTASGCGVFRPAAARQWR
jgi:hypothetical protein